MRSEDSKKHNIYCDLDSIYDTRFALLSVLNPDLVRGEVLERHYFRRKSDKFKFISCEIFNRIYKRRNVELLSISRPTPIIKHIADYIDSLTLANNIDGTEEKVNLYINVYPYEINEKEMEEIRFALLPFFLNINNIFIMRERNISPRWLDDNCAFIVMYDGLDWINRNDANGELLKASLLDAIIIIPKLLYTNEKVTDDDFKLIEEHAKINARIIFLPVRNFCIK